jgi:hypothetical protein
MANRERGEVALEVDGRTYTFCLDLNALTELEALFSTPDREVSFVEVVGKAEQGHAKYIRGVFWAALKRHHPDITLMEAADVIQGLGGIFGGQLQALLSQATGGAKPDPADIRELGEGVGKRPRKARVARVNGTGESSTSRPDASI